MKHCMAGAPIRLSLLLAALAIVVSVQAAPPDSPLAGTWRLAEQGRGGGRAGDATLLAPAGIECLPAGPEISCRNWSAGPPPKAFDWPAFVTDDGPLPVRVLRREIDAGAGRLLAEYEVEPPGSSPRLLKVIEDYRVRGRGDLAGIVRVTLFEDGEDQGSYTLHRRFERVR